MEKNIQIFKNKVHSIERKHPWIFSGAIQSDTSEIYDGDTVSVYDSKNRFLARGHFQHATISVRILSFEDVPLDQSFFTAKIKNAFSVRMKQNLLRSDNNIFRLVHGEGDGLPGLIIDYYAGVAVIQCHSIGMYNSIPFLYESLIEVLGDNLQAIYSKSSDTLPERTEVENMYLHGDCATPHLAIEDGVKLNIDWVTGQKTGFFIDQRENRTLLGKYAKGKRVLNTFCYSGGFSLSALLNGAELVHSLDSSKKAIQLTDENIVLNKFSGKHESIVADAMNYMKDLKEDYDIIVLDPPAFAKHRNKRHQALQGYKRLNAHTIRQIKPGGIIFTFSCSQVVDKSLFTNTVIAASIEAGRNVRILEQLHQPADHPINAFHPEGEYLKGLVIQVD
ncbi:MAG: class I SAM-dependent rRNA methyltransferase [Crocinitomicaceae bacterium]|nr:class I SAM-dependent rRNA methyltransferase [Crocinitomicaceae bacterium]